MITKYDFSVSEIEIAKTCKRLTNQLWKLIPMRENGENWERQLDCVVIELAGLNELFPAFDLVILLSKLEGLKCVENSFEVYRKIVFESISLLQRCQSHE